MSPCCHCSGVPLGCDEALLHDVVQCHSGAGGGCGLGWDVTAVVEHDITGVHGAAGGSITVAGGMGWPHREPAPTLPMMWAEERARRYMRSHELPPAVRGLEHNPLPAPWLPSRPIPPSSQGIASHSCVWRQMSPTCHIPAMGPASSPCAAWLHSVWVPMAPPALLPSSC